MKIWCGIDNGSSGSIGIVSEDGSARYLQTPSKKEQSYTKTEQTISRIDFPKLKDILAFYPSCNLRVFLERPYVNPQGFKATTSALRALEATIIALEWLGMSFQYIDSKEWQKEMLPAGIKGTPELKKASADIGCRLFPALSEEIRKQKDADGLLIAEWARRNNK